MTAVLRYPWYPWYPCTRVPRVPRVPQNTNLYWGLSLWSSRAIVCPLLKDKNRVHELNRQLRLHSSDCYRYLGLIVGSLTAILRYPWYPWYPCARVPRVPRVPQNSCQTTYNQSKVPVAVTRVQSELPIQLMNSVFVLQKRTNDCPRAPETKSPV